MQSHSERYWDFIEGEVYPRFCWMCPFRRVREILEGNSRILCVFIRKIALGFRGSLGITRGVIIRCLIYSLRIYGGVEF